MHNEEFRAHTHYGDFKGTAAADDLDLDSIDRYLEQKGLIQPDEFLAGVKMSWGALKGAAKTVTISALLAKTINYEGLRALAASEEPLPLRKAEIDIPLEDFFGCFKQFEIALSRKGEIDGKQIKFL